MRSLATIARVITADWTKPYFGAVPYLQAMRQLDKPSDMFGFDSGSCIIRYFLANASTWRGAVAREIKAELKGMLGR